MSKVIEDESEGNQMVKYILFELCQLYNLKYGICPTQNEYDMHTFENALEMIACLYSFGVL